MNYAETLSKHCEIIHSLKDVEADFESALKMMRDCLHGGNKILFCGNGGSASDAQHLAAELVGRFKIDRMPLAGLSLVTDSSVLTSISNDYEFSEIFGRQVSALGQPGDCLFAISTSGGSRNVVNAAEVAKRMNIKVVALTGRGGGELASMADIVLCVESSDTARIQEAHILLGHMLCERLEKSMFGV